MKAAVIDIGTNTVKLCVGEIDENRQIEILMDTVQVSRLGEGVDSQKLLQPQAQQRTIAVISGFVKLAQELGANNIKIVATSAMRDACNAQEFACSVKSQIGIDLEILSEKDECRLSYLSVILDPDLGNFEGKQAVMDIGGGSTELIFGDNNGILFANSLKLGAVRLTERILKTDPPCPAEIKELRNIAEKAISEAACGMDVRRVVQVGGSGVNVARIFKHVPPSMTNLVHGIILTPAEIRNILQFLSGMSVEERKAIVGLEPDRADIILAGAIILDSVVSVLKAEEIVISIKGLRHGVLCEMLGY